MKLDKQRIDQLVKERLVARKEHSTKPLYILKYTDKMTYRGVWDELTLFLRTVVIDHDYNVVSSGFKKFFNIEENPISPTWEYVREKASRVPYVILEKIDGHLVTLFNYDNEWIITTSGGFSSSLSDEDLKYLARDVDTNLLNKKYTYIFESISEGNKINNIILSINGHYDYKKNGLYLLSVKNEKREFTYEELVREAEKIYTCEPMITNIHDHTLEEFEVLMKDPENDTIGEGGILWFSDGERVKLKCAWYWIEYSKYKINVRRFRNHFTLQGVEGWHELLDEQFIPKVDELIEQYNQFINQKVIRFKELVSQYDKPTILQFFKDGDLKKSEFMEYCIAEGYLRSPSKKVEKSFRREFIKSIDLINFFLKPESEKD